MLINEDLKKIFGEKYYQKICNYIDVIQSAIDTHDIVIFMARKAYCFYQALQANNLIHSKDTCTIFSSRAITYNGVDYFNKKVAVIEDVVILGESLFEAINEENINKVTAEIYMLACSKDFWEKVKIKNINCHFYPSMIKENDDLLELATLITNYIIYEMVPYNADYPAYCFRFANNEELDCYLNNYNFYMITDLVHCKNHSIKEGVIQVDDKIFSDFLSKQIIDDSIFKIRVYIDQSKKLCYLIPIVIFSTLQKLELESIYNNLFSSTYDSFVFVNTDDNATMKNKLRILCYKLAELMFLTYLKDIIKNYDIEKISSEQELFTKELSLGNVSLLNNTIKSKKNQTYVDQISLYNSLGYSYDLLIENFDFSIGVNFKTDYISFNDIRGKISIVEKDPQKLKLLSSLILDVFIDNGVIVPRVKIEGNYIFRLFKFGEVAKLTANDFVLFSLILGEYSDLVERTLDKTEIEKVSVLFFRKYNNNFDVANNEAEAYRICYSKFGPRISSSNFQYSVSQGQALTDVLINRGFIRKVSGDKYNVEPLSQKEENNKVKQSLRTIFAIKLSKLHKFYVSAQNSDPNNEVFKYINSYIRLLTLISIGNNEQDKILSLIAEVDLIKSRNLSRYDDIQVIIRVFDSIVDGILSGVWKYFCYKNVDLLENTFALMKTHSKEDNAFLAIDVFLEASVYNNNLIHTGFLDEIGCFLYDVAIFYSYLCKYTKTKLHDDYGKPPYRYFLNSKFFNEIHQKYKQIFSQEKEQIDRFINEHLQEIENISYKLFDKYQIYDVASSLNYETYSECVVIFNYNIGDDVASMYRKLNDLKVYKCDDVLIIPFQKEYKKHILNRVVSSLDSVDTKALYFASSDENTLLYSASSSFSGKKFIEEIYSAIKFIRENMTSTVSRELFILPKKEFDSKEFTTNLFLYEHVEKKLYQHPKCIYKYHFKEEQNMNVNTINVYGNMYNIENIEQISGDLTLLGEKCQDAQVKQYIKEAEDAIAQKDQSKLKSCLNWLGKHAFDFVKSIGSSTIIELIKSAIV